MGVLTHAFLRGCWCPFGLLVIQIDFAGKARARYKLPNHSRHELVHGHSWCVKKCLLFDNCTHQTSFTVLCAHYLILFKSEGMQQFLILL